MIYDFYSLGKNNTNLLDKFAVLKSIEYDIDFEKEVFKKDKKTKENSSEKIPLYPVIINFNTKEDKIEIGYGKQEECKEYLCLEKKSSNSKKISFYTNNIMYHFTITIKNMIEALQDCDNPEYDSFKNYLMNIFNNFFKEVKLLDDGGKEYFTPVLDFNKIEDKKIKEELLKIDLTDTKFESKINKLLTDYKSGIFNKNNRVYLIKINNAHILSTEFKEDYIQVLYNIYFKELEDKLDGICHICNRKEKVLLSVDLPLKFFIKDKQEFFSNNEPKNLVKSFSICKECYLYSISGMKYVENLCRKNTYLDYKFLVIPKRPVNETDYGYILYLLNEQLKQKFSKSNIEKLEKSKIDDIIFSLLFYLKETKTNSFKIIKEINDLSYFNIRKINKLLESTNNELPIVDYTGNENYFGLGNIKEILFSNLLSKKIKNKTDKVIKELLEIIYAVYSNIPIDKSFLINQVLSNYKKNYYDKYTTSNSNNLLKSYLFIQFLIKNKNLEMMNMQIETYTKIQNKEFLEFFEKNRNLNEIEKGLITFGFLINRLVYEQTKKEKSSTFIKKVGFDGLDVQDLKELFSELEEYREIYKINKYDNAETSFVSEIISKIQKDSISPIEINYYILFGIELGKYIGIKMSGKTNQGEKNE